MKVVAIIQARMGSTRLPGKILKTVLGKPLLSYQLERLNECCTLNEIIIATTTKQADDVIAAFCEKSNVPVYRGSEEDVLARYYEAAKKYEADVIVRITSDCPIIDPEIVDKVVKCYLNDPIYDYVSNTMERCYPRGMDTSLVPFKTLEKVYLQSTDPLDREHVTRYIYQRPEQYKLLSVKEDNDYSDYRWTVDTIEDYEVVRKIIETLYPMNPHFTMYDALELLKNYPEWKKINEHIEQKKV